MIYVYNPKDIRRPWFVSPRLLYYSPHIHADYVPFLARVMKAPELPPQAWSVVQMVLHSGNMATKWYIFGWFVHISFNKPRGIRNCLGRAKWNWQEWLLKFFQHLYCGLMSDALAMLRLEAGFKGCFESGYHQLVGLCSTVLRIQIPWISRNSRKILKGRSAAFNEWSFWILGCLIFEARR